MMRWHLMVMIVILDASLLAAGPANSASPDPNRGQRVFAACAACHSLEPNRNMTGPSLAGVFDRKAGSVASFPRYSSALKSSGIIWNDKNLDSWIKTPEQLIPGNEMPFEGIKDNGQRADLLAFLKQASQPGQAPQASGMMGGTDSDLKTVGADQRVREITYCGDTFRVTTAGGRTRAFWERNLRLK